MEGGVCLFLVLALLLQSVCLQPSVVSAWTTAPPGQRPASADPSVQDLIEETFEETEESTEAAKLAEPAAPQWVFLGHASHRTLRASGGVRRILKAKAKAKAEAEMAASLPSRPSRRSAKKPADRATPSRRRPWQPACLPHPSRSKP